jgi:hypothetical protein
VPLVESGRQVSPGAVQQPALPSAVSQPASSAPHEGWQLPASASQAKSLQQSPLEAQAWPVTPHGPRGTQRPPSQPPPQQTPESAPQAPPLGMHDADGVAAAPQ